MNTMELPLFWSRPAVRPVCDRIVKGKLLEECPYWLAVKEMQDGAAYAFWALVMNDEDKSLTLHDEYVIATMREVIEHGAKMIFQVDDLPTMSNLRVLYRAGNN
ncbi:MAG: hypothetical protein ACYC7E_03820 [Armatimonadota bacterium]